MSPRFAAPLLRACSLSAALALVACSADSSPSSLAPTAPALSAARRALPFHGTVEATQKPVRPPVAGVALLHLEGEGNATHLGRFTIASDLTLNLATLAGTEQLTLTAANGDVLTATATAQGTANADGVTVTTVETVTVTGGTGRFAGVTGSFILERLVIKATGVSSGSFDGTITLSK